MCACLFARQDEEEPDDDSDHDEEARLGEDVGQLGGHVESWKKDEPTLWEWVMYNVALIKICSCSSLDLIIELCRLTRQCPHSSFDHIPSGSRLNKTTESTTSKKDRICHQSPPEVGMIESWKCLVIGMVNFLYKFIECRENLHKKLWNIFPVPTSSKLST